MGFCPIFGRIQGKMSPWGQYTYSNPSHPNPQSPVGTKYKKCWYNRNNFYTLKLIIIKKNSLSGKNLLPTGIRHFLVPQNDTGAGLIILGMKRVVKFFDNMIYQLSRKYFWQQNNPMFSFLNTIPCKSSHSGRIEWCILNLCP